MKIFIDTADLAEIRRAAAAGLIDGITTNPSLMAKVVGDSNIADYMKEVAEAVDALAARFGSGTVTRAALLEGDDGTEDGRSAVRVSRAVPDTSSNTTS